MTIQNNTHGIDALKIKTITPGGFDSTFDSSFQQLPYVDALLMVSSTISNGVDSGLLITNAIQSSVDILIVKIAEVSSSIDSVIGFWVDRRTIYHESHSLLSLNSSLTYSVDSHLWGVESKQSSVESLLGKRGLTQTHGIDAWKVARRTKNHNISSYISPINDMFANAIELVGNSLVTTGSNAGATFETGEPPYSYTDKTVWWYWTAPEDGVLTVTTQGSDFDTVLSIYTGTQVDALTTLENNDEAYYAGIPDGWEWSYINIPVTSGTKYYIRVGGYSSNSGNIQLNLTLSYVVSHSVDSEIKLTYHSHKAVSMVGETPAYKDVLYLAQAGANKTSNLYSLNPNTAELTLIGSLDVALTGLAVDPTTNIIYGSTSNNSLNSRSLVRIDTTGATVIGSFGFSGTFTDITFDENGQLYGFSTGDDFATIDKATGLATFIAYDPINGWGTGLDYNPISDEMYILPDSDSGTLYKINETTGTVIPYKDLDGSGGTIGAATFDFSDNIWVISARWNGIGFLEKIDSNGHVTRIDNTGIWRYCGGLVWGPTKDWNLPQPPSNDDFDDAIVLSIPDTRTGTTAHSTIQSYDEWWWYTHTVWYKYTPSVDTALELTVTSPSDLNLGIALFTDTDPDYPSVGYLEYESYDSWLNTSLSSVTMITNKLTVGTTYYIQVSSEEVGQFTLNALFAPIPSNDNFEDATEISGAINLVSEYEIDWSGSNLYATKETGEYFWNGSGSGRSVWYKFTPAFTMIASLEFTASYLINGHYPICDVYTGASVTTLTAASTTNHCWGTTHAYFRAVAGTTYYFQVYDEQHAGSIGGDFSLKFLASADDFADSIELVEQTTDWSESYWNFEGFLKESTMESGEPNHYIGASTLYSVWFHWTAPSTGQYFIESAKSRLPHVAVYTGAAVNSLTETNSVQTTPCAPAKMRENPFTFYAQSGVTYHIAVGAANTYYFSDMLPFDLELKKLATIVLPVGGKVRMRAAGGYNEVVVLNGPTNIGLDSPDRVEYGDEYQYPYITGLAGYDHGYKQVWRYLGTYDSSQQLEIFSYWRFVVRDDIEVNTSSGDQLDLLDTQKYFWPVWVKQTANTTWKVGFTFMYPGNSSINTNSLDYTDLLIDVEMYDCAESTDISGSDDASGEPYPVFVRAGDLSCYSWPYKWLEIPYSGVQEGDVFIVQGIVRDTDNRYIWRNPTNWPPPDDDNPIGPWINPYNYGYSDETKIETYESRRNAGYAYWGAEGDHHYQIFSGVAGPNDPSSGTVIVEAGYRYNIGWADDWHSMAVEIFQLSIWRGLAFENDAAQPYSQSTYTYPVMLQTVYSEGDANITLPQFALDSNQSCRKALSLAMFYDMAGEETEDYSVPSGMTSLSDTVYIGGSYERSFRTAYKTFEINQDPFYPEITSIESNSTSNYGGAARVFFRLVETSTGGRYGWGIVL